MGGLITLSLMSSEGTPSNNRSKREVRFSLRELVNEVKVERRDSHFGRQLVDSTEIDKMFSKNKRKKKKAK